MALSPEARNSLAARLLQRANHQPGLSSSDREEARRWAGLLTALNNIKRESSPAPPIDDPYLQWTYNGLQAAWGHGQNLHLTAIPLFKKDLAERLGTADYFSRLADRVAWMIARAGDPEDGIMALLESLEAVDGWMGHREFASPDDATYQMIEENPMFPNLFNGSRLLPMVRPWKPRIMPAAHLAMMECELENWLAIAYNR